MFVQVIRGPVDDAEGLRRQLDRWKAEVAPRATGFLGSTAGVTKDGQAVLFARFESEEAARANSDRPEQSSWWAETEKWFSQAPTFADSTDVEEWMGGGSDSAGFVQVMAARVPDRDRLSALDRAFEAEAGRVRPDVIGGVRAWTGPNTYVEAVYFTSEAEARAGESAEMPEELQQMMAEYAGLTVDVEYLDLPDPWLYSA